jgi:tetratricopeptide (TPR) repeat protein
MSQTATCCPTMDTVWTQQMVDNHHLADVFACTSCGHVHRTEKYMVPLRFPRPGRCANCSGDQVPAGGVYRCNQCGKTAQEDKEYADKLAAIHPSRQYVPAAEALGSSGRNALALKLATAEVMFGEDPVSGMFLRINLLGAMGLVDKALDEALEWSDLNGAPVELHGLIAQLQAEVGNVQGAMHALERGLKADPEHWEWYCDLAEILLETDDRGNALRMAAKALKNADTRKRALAVVLDVGERFYAAGMYAEALSACSAANDLQESTFALAWLRARIASSQGDTTYMVKWLETAVALDPSHPEANQMLEPYKKKGGWFSWGRK